MLARVARSAARAIPDADGVTITVLGNASPRTAAHTDDRMLRLDDAQYESTRGPCLEAADTRHPVRVMTELGEQRWPEFINAARSLGVSASLSVPLIVATSSPQVEGQLVGSLNVYSQRAAAFDPFDEELMRLYTVTACHTITNAHRWQKSRDEVAQLEQTLTTRSVIDQAKGVMRAIHGCTAEEAFAMLVERSQNANVKLHLVAAELLDSLSKPSEKP